MTGTALVQTGDPGTAVTRPNAQRATRLLRPIAQPADIISAQDATRAMVHQALKEGRDYGKIPGTDKPTLLKPGAERVALGFGCYYGEPVLVEQEIDHDREVRWTKRKKQWKNRHNGDREFDWIEDVGLSLGLYRYVVKVPVIDRSTGEVVGAGIGACSSMESKYVDRPRDSENTVLKMAHKRAIVAAALITFGLSDEFTQDVEDLAAAVATEDEPPITRDSEITFGKSKGTAIKDLPTPYLTWAVEPGRKLGPDTAKWQAAMTQEIEHRKRPRATTPAAPAAAVTPEPSAAVDEQIEDDILAEDRRLFDEEHGR
jgi:uncharacterized protein (DUF3820 family)